MGFARVEPAYTSGEGCRLVWAGDGGDEEHAVVLGGPEMASLVELLRRGTAGKVGLEDGVGAALVNSDVTQFSLRSGMLEADTGELRGRLLEYARVPHGPRYSSVPSKEFYPSARPGGGPAAGPRAGRGAAASLHEAILARGAAGGRGRDLFDVMARRRSTRRFSASAVEGWKVDKILAAADTAPTAGNFQGFQVFYVKGRAAKRALAEAANNQPYVDAPVVLVFCMEPSRVRMDFPPGVLEKFSLQDATLAAAYSQLAASALGLSSVWIGMLDEGRVMSVLGTGLRPSSILCVGYPAARRPPRPRRKLKDLIRVVE